MSRLLPDLAVYLVLDPLLCGGVAGMVRTATAAVFTPRLCRAATRPRNSPHASARGRHGDEGRSRWPPCPRFAASQHRAQAACAQISRQLCAAIGG